MGRRQIGRQVWAILVGKENKVTSERWIRVFVKDIFLAQALNPKAHPTRGSGGINRGNLPSKEWFFLVSSAKLWRILFPNVSPIGTCEPWTKHHDSILYHLESVYYQSGLSEDRNHFFTPQFSTSNFRLVFSPISILEDMRCRHSDRNMIYTQFEYLYFPVNPLWNLQTCSFCKIQFNGVYWTLMHVYWF